MSDDRVVWGFPAMGSSTDGGLSDSVGGAQEPSPSRLSDAVPSLFTPNTSSFKVQAFGASRYPTMPSADFCPAVKTSSPVFSRCRFRFNDTRQISRGKTRILPRIDAGFTKCTLAGVATDAVDRGLGGHVPAGPECISLAGRPGARGTCSSPVTNSSQGLFVYGLSLISGFCSSSHDFALNLPTAPRLATTHLLFG